MTNSEILRLYYLYTTRARLEKEKTKKLEVFDVNVRRYDKDLCNHVLK